MIVHGDLPPYGRGEEKHLPQVLLHPSQLLDLALTEVGVIQLLWVLLLVGVGQTLQDVVSFKGTFTQHYWFFISCR